MELTVNKKTLSESLSEIAGSVDKHVLIKATESLSFFAANSTISTESTSECEIKKPGEVCVDYSKLASFAKSYRGETITLKTTKAGWLSIQGDNIKVRFPNIPEASYPVVKFNQMEHEVKIEELKTAIAMTEFAVGQNKAREAMMGVNISFSDKGVFVYGADGFMLSRYHIDMKTGIDQSILIPHKSAKEIAKHDGKLLFSDRSVRVETDKLKLQSSLLESKYPNIEGILNEDKPYTAKVVKDDLAGFIDIMESVASVEKDPIVKFIFDQNKIEIISKRMETGDGDAVIECEYSGEKKEIGINVILLKKIISAYSQVDDSQIIFNLGADESLVVITTESLPNCRSGLMPVRIQW